MFDYRTDIMAYLAFDFEPATVAATALLSHEAEVSFSRHEWLVIRLARRDCSGNPHRFSRLTRLIGRLFGMRTTNPLADPKLEALRKAATGLWRIKSFASQADIDGLRGQGYSFGQIALLSSWIAEQD
jgi:hypothetical protein